MLSSHGDAVTWFSVPLGRLRVRLHTMVPLVAAVLVYWAPGIGLRYLLLLAVLLLHELGHALVSLAMGGARAVVSLSPAFGWADVTAFPDRREGWTALAGPAINLAVAGALALAGAGIDWSLRSASPTDFLLTVSLVMGVGNLIPFKPADGGRAFSAFWPTR